MHDVSFGEFEFLLMQDRRSFEDEETWLRYCCSDGFSLEVSRVAAKEAQPVAGFFQWKTG